ncbi:hypothetical protein BYT27DRAFT_6525953 [Phlegmacium glaucopus]|nr:hypothetical protein BYT27DRAFT_6525953 [Phlegmacium glaucopus]
MSIRSTLFKCQLLRNVAASEIAVKLLADSATPEIQTAFEDVLLSLIPAPFHNDIERENLFRSFLSWCADKSLSCPKELEQAIANRSNLKKKHRKAKRNFIDRVGLNWEAARRDEYLSGIPTTIIPALSTPYPPLAHWVFESDEIKEKWEYWISKAPQADARKKRLPMLRLDPGKLACDLSSDTSMIFQKEDGQLAGLVLRNFCPDSHTLSWLDDVIEGAAG